MDDQIKDTCWYSNGHRYTGCVVYDQMCEEINFFDVGGSCTNTIDQNDFSEEINMEELFTKIPKDITDFDIFDLAKLIETSSMSSLY